MAKQLHKRFSAQEVKMLIEKYLNEKVKLAYILEILKVKRSRFFELLKQYTEDPDNFSIQYKRKSATRRISDEVEKNIINELKKEKKLIEDKEIPVTFYNYSYIKDQIYQNYEQKVSLPTIIDRAKKVLKEEVERYNYQQVHSTTGEIPIIRFKRAVREKKSLFREFVIPSPYKSAKDIFCLRVKRTVDAYHKISISNLKLRVHKAPLREEVELRIAPDEKTGIAEVRIWYKGILTDIYRIKNSDLNLVHF